MGHCPVGPSAGRWIGRPHQVQTGRDKGVPEPMRTSRFVRSLVVAGTAAALSILSVVSAVMASTGGGDFPR